MIRSDPNKLSDCGTFSVDLGEKEDLKEGVKNSSGVFWLLADSKETEQKLLKIRQGR